MLKPRKNIKNNQLDFSEKDLVDWFDFSKNPEPMNFNPTKPPSKSSKKKKKTKLKKKKGPYGISKQKSSKFQKFTQH